MAYLKDYSPGEGSTLISIDLWFMSPRTPAPQRGMTPSVAWKDGSLCVKKEKAAVHGLVGAMPLKQEEMGLEEAPSSALRRALWWGGFLWCIILSSRGKSQRLRQ